MFCMLLSITIHQGDLYSVNRMLHYIENKFLSKRNSIQQSYIVKIYLNEVLSIQDVEMYVWKTFLVFAGIFK